MGALSEPPLSWIYLEVVRNIWIKIDVKDVVAVVSRSWRLDRNRHGRIRLLTSSRTKSGQITLSLERFLLQPSAGVFACQRDVGLKDDFRRSNLLACTLAERQRRLPKIIVETTSKYKGVSFDKDSSLWRATIRIDGESKNLGSFCSEVEAARAYDEAVNMFFGAAAFRNDIQK